MIATIIAICFCQMRYRVLVIIISSQYDNDNIIIRSMYRTYQSYLVHTFVQYMYIP
jgi:hypothetical protein